MAGNAVKSLNKMTMVQVAGGTASGKSTVCEKIMESLRQIDLENVERQVVLCIMIMMMIVDD